MTDYLNIWADFQGKQITRAFVEPLFNSDFFHPIAIGGLDFKHNWFLSGYALEDFFAKLHWGADHKPASIELGAQNAPMQAYLEAIAGHMNKLERPVNDLSPFEEIDSVTSVTYLAGNARLDSAVLDTLDNWFTRFDCVHIAVFGALRLAVNGAVPWQTAYQFVSEQDGEQVDLPFVNYDVRITPRIPNTISLTLETRATVWLQNAGALNGRVGAAEADHNIAQLGALAKTLTEAAPKLESVELTLRGDAFRAERVRVLKPFGTLRNLEIDTG